MNIKNALLTLTLLASAPIIGAERPPQPSVVISAEQQEQDKMLREKLASLPGDIQREVLYKTIISNPDIQSMESRIDAFRDKLDARTILDLLKSLPSAKAIKLSGKIQFYPDTYHSWPVMNDAAIVDWQVQTQKKITKNSQELLEAVRRNDKQKVTLVLQENDIDVDWISHAFGNPVNALFIAANRGETEIVKLLLKAGANPNLLILDVGDRRPRNALLEAVELGRKNTVEALLAAGARSYINDSLIQAVQFGYLEIARLLLNAGANPNYKTTYGTTPLMASARVPFAEDLIRLLINAGADPDARNNEEKSATDIAYETGKYANARIIEEASKKRKGL